MLGVPQNMADGDTVSAAGGRLQTTTERGAGLRVLVPSILSIAGSLTAPRTATFPDRSLTLRGVSGTQTNNRLSKFDANGDQTDSQIADAVTGNVLSIAATFTAPRTQQVQDAAGTIPLLEVNPAQSFRNKIINGDLRVWQRGTSFTGVVSANTYTADRSYYFVDGTLGAFSVSQQSFALGTISPELPFFYRFNVTATGSGSSNTVAYGQRIEGVRTFANRRIVVSFWAKADAVRTITPRAVQVMGTGGAPSGNVTTTGTAINLSTTWTQYAQAITVPSLSGKTLGTNGDDCLAIELLAANNTVETIDLCMIEVRDAPASEGTLLLPWELRPLQIEFLLCLRYFEIISQFSGTCASTTSAQANLAFIAPKRAIPTITTPVAMRVTDSIGNFTQSTATSATYLGDINGGALVGINNLTGLTVGRYIQYNPASTSDRVYASSDL